jgi:hypothetical protein
MFAHPAVVVGSAAAVLGTAAALLTPAQPRWRGAADGWHLPAGLSGYYTIDAESDRLDATHAEWHRQIAASEEVVTRLVDGGLTLPAEANELEQINADRHPFHDGLYFRFTDTPNHRLRLARWAVDMVCKRLGDAPTRLAEVSARLEAELRVMLAAG